MPNLLVNSSTLKFSVIGLLISFPAKLELKDFSAENICLSSNLEKSKSDVHPTLTLTLNNIIVYTNRLDSIIDMSSVSDEYKIEIKINEEETYKYNVAVPTKKKWPYTSKESNLILYKLK